MSAKKGPTETKCGGCDGTALVTTRAQRHAAKVRGYGYCSDACRETGHRARQAASLRGFKHSAETRAKFSAGRKGKALPTGRKLSPESRARMKAAKKGWKPVGMHGVPTATEALLLERLGAGWLLHHKIGKYVVDLANPNAKLVVEADGYQHTRPNASKQRERDAERDAFLQSQGWTVLRATNNQITRRIT